ncbi:hypothetical protein KIL84_006295 [Mauremys mutica]|uniref:Uncharacterized protein n=1 Tax=Mauremys mutica TaxID=74926 RepID=A0A9D3WZ20_9SAUR|nr:hypothetical protein KIL84_006295 [Mauremys mutica]
MEEDADVATLGGELHYYNREAKESGPGAQCEWLGDWAVSVLYMLVSVLGLSGNGLVTFTRVAGVRGPSVALPTPSSTTRRWPTWPSW